MPERVVVVGAGSSGIFTSIELSLRGFDVTLVDRGIAGSGTSGRFHGLLHSGARYAVTDRAAAKDCRIESRRIIEMAPHCVEQTSGLFVALNENDEAYGEELRNGLRECSIPFREHDRTETLALEHNLTGHARCSVEVPDSVLNGRLFLLCALITATDLGVRYMPFRELSSAEFSSGREISSVRFANGLNGGMEEVRTDFVVNCAGAWVAEAAEKLGAGIRVLPAAGIMSVVPSRLVLRVINRMRRPSDGDILVPFGSRTIAGTTAAVTENPGQFEISPEDVGLLMDEAASLVPAVRDLGFTRSYASFRPLVSDGNHGGRDATRDFRILRDESKVKNLVNVVGGKMTTCMLIGERAADAVSAAMGGRMKSHMEVSFFNPFDRSAMEMHGFNSENSPTARALHQMIGGPDEEDLMAIVLLTLMTERRSR